MVGWQRHLQSFIRHAGKSLETNYGATANHSVTRINSSSIGQFHHLFRSTDSSSTGILRPFHQYLQQVGISSSRKLLADSSSDATPIPSPLSSPVLAIESGKTENQAVVSKPATVQAILKAIKQSPKKVNLVAAFVRGMRVEDALLQLQLTVKRSAKTAYQVIHSARANATHNHGLDPDRLLIAEAFVGKGFFKKRVSYHAKGKSGIKVRPECRLTVVVREMTPGEEAEVARLRVSNFRKLSKRERQLVPHQLIETTSVWGRKAKSGRREASSKPANSMA